MPPQKKSNKPWPATAFADLTGVAQTHMDPKIASSFILVQLASLSPYDVNNMEINIGIDLGPWKDRLLNMDPMNVRINNRQ
jgi:hypothetical protein